MVIECCGIIKKKEYEELGINRKDDENGGGGKDEQNLIPKVRWTR